MPALSIQEQLPGTATFSGDLTSLLGAFESLSGKIDGFSPGDLADLVQQTTNLPIPTDTSLIEPMLESLREISRTIASNPEDLLDVVLKEIGNLNGDLGNLIENLGPVRKLVEALGPVISNLSGLNQVITQSNTIITAIPNLTDGLSFTNLVEGFEAFNRIFALFPTLNTLAPFVALKSQMDTIHTWLTLDASALSTQFQTQIQTIANALPVRLNTVMGNGVTVLQNLDTTIQGMARSQWFDPYQQAIALLQNIDIVSLNSEGAIVDFYTQIDNQFSPIQTVSTQLHQTIGNAVGLLDGFGFDQFSQETKLVLQQLINTVKPQPTEFIALVFRKVRLTIEGIQLYKLVQAIDQFEAQLTDIIGENSFADNLANIQEIPNRITGITDTVNQNLVQVAATLSNLTTQLQAKVDAIDISAFQTTITGSLNTVKGAIEGIVPRVETVKQQIQAFIDQLQQDFDNLDFGALTTSLENALNQIVAVFEDPAVKDVLEKAQKGIDEMAEKLEGLSLKPVFDEVEGQINDLKAKLAEVDVSELNDFLKNALKVSLDIVVKIDFAKDVSAALNEQFNKILEPVLALIEPLKAKFLEIKALIEEFNVGELVSDQLSPVFESIVNLLEKIEPGQFFTPLKDAHQVLMNELNAFDPLTLLTPLSDLHGQAIAALQTISPQELINKINPVLDVVKEQITQLGIDQLLDLVNEVSGGFQQILNDLNFGSPIPGADFWDTFANIQLDQGTLLSDFSTRIDDFLDEIVNAIPNLDMAIIKPALDALHAAIGQIRDHVQAPQVLSILNTIQSQLGTIDVQAGATEITQSWLAQKQRFNEAKPTTGPLAAPYEILLEKIEQLSPIDLLAASLTRFSDLETTLGATGQTLNDLQTYLARTLAEHEQLLLDLLPQDQTLQGFKDLLKKGLDEQLGQPIKDVLNALNQQLDNVKLVFERIKAVGMQFKAPLNTLMIIPNVFTSLSDTLTNVKETIEGINLNFLADELNAVVNSVLDKLNALDPAQFNEEITAILQATQTVADNLYPQEAIDSLDALYEDTILKKVHDFHPDKTVAAPLQDAYQQAVAAQDILDVEKLFDVVKQKLESINLELEEGLIRTEKAFNGMLSALPV